MKRNLIFFMTFMLAYNMSAQIAKWLIPPVYDNIQMLNGTDLIMTDSLQQKILWTFDGRRLNSTNDNINPYSDSYGVVTKRQSSEIKGFFNEKGDFININESYSVLDGDPYFHYGHLVVLNSLGFSQFLDTEGNLAINKIFQKAYPFINGYASCIGYANQKKPNEPKDPYHLLLNKNNEEVTFSCNGEEIKTKDLEFISSINDENIGFIVADHRVYQFNGLDKQLTPVLIKGGEINPKKNQAKVEGNIIIPDNDVLIITANCGKKDVITIEFDKALRPTRIKKPEGDYIYKHNSVVPRTLSSHLHPIENKGKYGLDWKNGDEILPPQFEQVSTHFDNKAFVKLGGKYGMLCVQKNDYFKITINKGEDIPFRHYKYETQMRIDFPTYISAYKTSLSILSDSGCDVDLTSKSAKDTDYGNFVVYNCVLTIPDSLPDEMYGDERNEIVYPIQMVYDKFQSPIIDFKVKAWHYKYFNVDVNDAETSIKNGTVTFTFDINAERNLGDMDYSREVALKTDSLNYNVTKQSETRFKCEVMSLKEGVNNIFVNIFEKDCPPASFPFEVEYTKTKPSRNKSVTQKEQVKIRKKPKMPEFPIIKR